jgi:hypothetical protein
VADLREKFTPTDYAVKRQMMTQKYGVRGTQLFNWLGDDDELMDAIGSKCSACGTSFDFRLPLRAARSNQTAGANDIAGRTDRRSRPHQDGGRTADPHCCHSYTGATVIKGGVIQIAAEDALGAKSSLVLQGTSRNGALTGWF